MISTKTPITRETPFKDNVTFSFLDFKVNVETGMEYVWFENSSMGFLLDNKKEIKKLIRCLKLCLKEIKQVKEVQVIGAFDPLQGKE